MKPMIKLLATLSLAAATTVGSMTAFESTASAQEVQLTGPLKGAPAVHHLVLYREGRIEIAPSFTSTILDEFNRTLLVGARVNYGITDWLAIGVWGAFGVAQVSTGLTDQIQGDQGQVNNLTNINLPTAQQGTFTSQVGKISYVLMPQLTVVPFRGKFALFKSLFADVDAYLFAGGGIVGTKERAFCDLHTQNDTDACYDNHGTQGFSHVAPTWGLGFNFYLNDFIGLGLEYRMIPFAWNRAGFDSRGLNASGVPTSGGAFPDGKIDASDQTYKFNQMVSLFLGFSFPLKPKVTD